MGGAISSVTNAFRDVIGTVSGVPGLNLIADATGGVLDAVLPGDPGAPSSGPKKLETGQIVGEGTGKAFSEEESESRRKAVRRKRLGTKALQIPLEKTSTGLATSSNLGLKV